MNLSALTVNNIDLSWPNPIRQTKKIFSTLS